MATSRYKPLVDSSIGDALHTTSTDETSDNNGTTHYGPDQPGVDSVPLATLHPDQQNQNPETSPSDSGPLDRSYIPKKDQILVNEKTLNEHGASEGSITVPLPRPRKACSWLPWTLKLPCLISLVFYTFLLCATTAFLTAYSSVNRGIARDGDSTAVFFSWRFLPTLLAVIYVVMLSTLLRDVRRTEVLARLSKSQPAPAAVTLCFPERSWWNDPFDALSKSSNNGQRSWALFFASIPTIVGLLFVSPLSAAFLFPRSVAFTVAQPFLQYAATPGFSLDTRSNDTMMLQTISANTLDSPSSAWIGNDYFVAPFWPEHLGTIPLSSSFSAVPLEQTWSGESIAYEVQLECTPVSLVELVNTTVKEVGSLADMFKQEYTPDEKVNLTAYNLMSEDNVSIVIYERLNDSLMRSILQFGGGWWVKAPTNTDFGQDLGPFARTVSPIVGTCSGDCARRSLFVVADSGESADEFQMKGGLCSSTFMAARVNVTVDVRELLTSVSFDQAQFDLNKKSLDSGLYNLSALEDMLFKMSWSDKFLQSGVPPFSGPLQGIAAGPRYNYDLNAIMQSETTIQDLTSFQQQWVGQILLASLTTSTHPVSDAGEGYVVTEERRIVAAVAIGVTLSTLLFASGVCIILVIITTRLSSRPLQVPGDPARIAILASVVTSNKCVSRVFAGLDRASSGAIFAQLERCQFNVINGRLLTDALAPRQSQSHKTSPDSATPSSTTMPNSRPLMLRTWIGLLLLTLIILLISALITLYAVSLTKGLSQRGLLYEYDFRIDNVISRITPYSIAPVLVAVAAKLWYGALSDLLKRQQPFTSLANSDKLQDPSKSLMVEYANAPLFCATFKAVRHKHWMLALVGLGTLAMEIFTVGMSALWNRETVSTPHQVDILRQLELRAVPRLYRGITFGLSRMEDPRTTLIIEDLFGNYTTSWLYRAAIEVTQNAPAPSWTRDDWAFTPVNLEQTENAARISRLQGDSRLSNITIDTQALRARLECQPLPTINENKTVWLEHWDLYNMTIDPRTNTTMWNDTNRPKSMDEAWEIKTTIDGFVNRTMFTSNTLRVLACCSNITDKTPGEAAIGYWNTDQPSIGGDIGSLVSKWIVGEPLDGLYNDSFRQIDESTGGLLDQHWLWTKEPSFQAVECHPIIERANASVTVDATTGTVRTYTVLGDPTNATEAWSDNYFNRVLEGANSYYDGNNMTASYGYLFWHSLLSASNLDSFAKMNPEDGSYRLEQDPSPFSLRQPGINVDLMSYTMLKVVGFDKNALLDADTLRKTASSTFATFFKHFASTNVSFTEGGYTFQPIGDMLPEDISDRVVNQSNVAQGYLRDGSFYQNSDARPIATSSQATLHVPVDKLVMSPVAVFLCIGMLVFLAMTVVVVFVLHRHRLKALPRDVDTLASVLALLYGSERLLEWVEQRTAKDDWKPGNTSAVNDEMRASLGTFTNKFGVQHWGIELSDSQEHEVTEPLLENHHQTG